MFRVLACLRDQHDYRLVLLAVLICAGKLHSIPHLRERTRQSGRQAAWLGSSPAWRRVRALGDAFRGDACLQDGHAHRLRPCPDLGVVADRHFRYRHRFSHRRSGESSPKAWRRPSSSSFLAPRTAGRCRDFISDGQPRQTRSARPSPPAMPRLSSLASNRLSPRRRRARSPRSPPPRANVDRAHRQRSSDASTMKKARDRNPAPSRFRCLSTRRSFAGIRRLKRWRRRAPARP
jgi:hypothetical protein